MIESTRENYYRTLAQIEQGIIKQLSKRSFYFAMVRLLVFTVGVIVVWLTKGMALAFPILSALLVLIILLYVIVLNNRLLLRKQFHEEKVRQIERELALIEYRFDGLDGATDAINDEHAFANDLDLFGDFSLFQYLNRSVAGLGRETLIGWLKSPELNKERIESRQRAIDELSQSREFLLDFQATGNLNSFSKAHRDELPSHFAIPSLIDGRNVIIALLYILPLATISILLCVIFGLLPLSFFTFLFVINLLVVGAFTKTINRIHQSIGKSMSLFTTFHSLFRLIIQQSFSSDLLVELQQRFHQNGVETATILKQLANSAERFNQRNNIFVAIFLNGILLRDLHTLLHFEIIKKKVAENLPAWLHALSEFDAVSSLAVFRFNHPEYIFPEIVSSHSSISITQMGHPLMHRDKCVRNELDIPTQPFFLIITGANMAGKSTYLRTLGVNYLLASLGAPVCATQFRWTPIALFTSLRTSDSLSKNESYFFAELKRLQQLIHRLESGERIFVILDEILKGTNSTDKQKGSLALIKHLLSLDAVGVVATHDLVLGTLVDTFPNAIANYRFEATIIDDQLSFDYRIQPGIAENMNACFLMEKMGIIQ